MELFEKTYTCTFCKKEATFFHYDSEEKTAVFAVKADWVEWIKNKWFCPTCAKERQDYSKDQADFNF